GATLERPARAAAVVRVAVAVHPGAAAAPRHRVGHPLGADLGLHRAGRVRHLLGDVSVLHAGHLAGDLAVDGVGHLAADRVGHLGADGLVDVGRAGHLLADRPGLPHLAGADLVGGAAGHAHAVAAATLAAGVARVAGAVALLLPDVVGPAGLAVGL